jgi:uncharacterized membrane protein YraQ (UPF0718 family)
MSWFAFSFQDFAFAFLSILFEGVPFLLAGSLIAGIVDVFVPSELLGRLLPKRSFIAILLSGLLGLIIPMCECGSVIVIRRFIKKGLPLSYAITYMLAAPIVNPLVILSTWAAFQGQGPKEMLWLRLGLGFGIAVVAGYIVGLLRVDQVLHPRLIAETTNKRAGFSMAAVPREDMAGDEDFAALAQRVSFGRKLLMVVQSATADFLDVAFFFVIGVALTSVFNTAVNHSVINPFAMSPVLSVIALMALAALLALCSNTDAFIAATFSSFPFAAKLAFLVFGPMFDLKLIWLYGLIFKRRFVLLLSLALFIVIAFICIQIGPYIGPGTNPMAAPAAEMK